MDYQRPSLFANSKQQRQTQQAANIYVSFAGADPSNKNTNGLLVDTPRNMWWDEERIEATVNRQFVASNLRADEQVRLDEPVGFGDGLTDDTYMEWIEEKAKRIFLILVDVGVPDQIFGVIDDSWDDDDLPVPLAHVHRLQLTYSKDEKMEKKFFQRQFMYLLKNIQKGSHIHYEDVEIVPLESAEKRPVGGLIQNHTDKVHLPGRPNDLLLRKKIPVGNEAGKMTNEDFFHGIESMRDVQHPHLISLWGSYQYQGNGFLLLTPVHDTTLKSVLAIAPQSLKIMAKGDRRMLLLKWLHCLASALAFLHSKGRSHQNIKPSNIMLDADNHIFLADSREFPMTATVEERKGFDQETYNHGAPEQSERPQTSASQGTSRSHSSRPGTSLKPAPPASTKESYDAASIHTTSTSSGHSHLSAGRQSGGKFDPQKSDVFSLGTIFLEILTFLLKRASKNFSSHRAAKNKTPGRGGGLPDSSFQKNLGQVDKWMQILGKDASKKEDKIFRGVKDILLLISKMLRTDPMDRPTAPEVVERMRIILTISSGIPPEQLYSMEREEEKKKKKKKSEWEFGFDDLRIASQKAAADACALVSANRMPIARIPSPILTDGVDPYDMSGLRSPTYTTRSTQPGSTATFDRTTDKSTSMTSSGTEEGKEKPRARQWQAPVYAEMTFA